MNSDHDIEVTEETSAAAEALESASETALDHAAATAVEAADLSDDEDGDEEEGDDEDGEESDEDGAEAAKLSGDDDEDEEGADDAVKAEGGEGKEDAGRRRQVVRRLAGYPQKSGELSRSLVIFRSSRASRWRSPSFPRGRRLVSPISSKANIANSRAAR